MDLHILKNQMLIPLRPPENPAEAGSNPAGPTRLHFRIIPEIQKPTMPKGFVGFFFPNGNNRAQSIFLEVSVKKDRFSPRICSGRT